MSIPWHSSKREIKKDGDCIRIREEFHSEEGTDGCVADLYENCLPAVDADGHVENQDGMSWVEGKRDKHIMAHRENELPEDSNHEQETEEVMVGLCEGDFVVPEFDQPATVDEAGSSEWIMAAVTNFGQILFEIPENLGSDQSTKEHAKELDDLLETDGSNQIFDICCQSVLLKHNQIDLASGSVDPIKDETLVDIGNSTTPRKKMPPTTCAHKTAAQTIKASNENVLNSFEFEVGLTSIKNEPQDAEELNNMEAISLGGHIISVKGTSLSRPTESYFATRCLSVNELETVADSSVISVSENPVCEVMDVESTHCHSVLSPAACSSQLQTESGSSELFTSQDTVFDLSTVDLVSKDSFINVSNELIVTNTVIAASKSNVCCRSPCISSLNSNSNAQVVNLKTYSEVFVSPTTGIKESPVWFESGNETNWKLTNTSTCSDKQQNSLKVPLTVLKRPISPLYVNSPKRKVFLLKRKIDQHSSHVTDFEKDMTEEGNDKQSETKKFVCSQRDCDWSFPTAYKLKRHEEAHCGHKDFMCYIDGCGHKFTTIYNLNTHMRLHDQPCTEFCIHPNCGETFRNKRLLDKHMKLHGNGEKTYKCPHRGCEKTFFSQMSIGSHARVHLHENEFVCEFNGCGRKFDKLCRLKQHMRSHTGEKPYPCSIEGCNWAFSTSSKLCRHLQVHNGQKRWRCPYEGCDKLFTRAEHVKGHLVTHSNARPFVCQIEGCDAKFKSKNSLDIHVKRHSQPEKNFKGIIFYCPNEDCSQRFNTKAQLRVHLEKHNEKNQGSSVAAAAASGEIFPMMLSLELENLENIVHSQMTSLSSSVDCVLLSSTTSGQRINSTINLLSLPVLVQSDPVLKGNTASRTSSPALRNSAGSARTDFQSYQLVAHRTRMNPDAKNKQSSTLIDIGRLKDLNSSSDAMSEQIGPGVMLDADEVMTSHAITFRDPETGTIYVQTQLLQDDPPNPDVYMYGSTLTLENDQPVLAAELSNMLNDEFIEDSNATFTGTTINLQDLE